MSIEDRLAQLEARVALMDDEKDIRDVLSRYGHFADGALDDDYFALFTDDCVMDVSSGIEPTPYDTVRWEGLAEMKRFMVDRAALHGDAFVGRSLHMQGNNLTVEVSGDTAIATGYSFILHQVGSQINLVSASINEWHFVRTANGWRIQMRKRRMVGAPDTAELLSHS